MSNIICHICGKKIMLSKANYKLDKYDNYIHKKCPKSKVIDDKDKIAYNSLKDKIMYYFTNYPSDYYKEHSLRWIPVTNSIKELHKRYTYEEIEFALDTVIKEMKQFYGFGAVVNRIDSIMEREKKRNEVLSTEKQVTVDFKFNANEFVEDW